MTYQQNQRTAGTENRFYNDTVGDLEAFLIDDEFDDALDRQLLAIRESLADFRNQ
jgi:hypothetical protein